MGGAARGRSETDMSRRRGQGQRNWWREAATLTRWGGMASAVCLLAMAFVHLRNQQVLAGRRIREHEARIEHLKGRIDDKEVAILRLQERSFLRSQVGTDFVDVIPFSSECVILKQP